jgi:hypothetical protein
VLASPPLAMERKIVRYLSLRANKNPSVRKELVMNKSPLWAALLGPADSGSLLHAIRDRSER